MKLDKKQLQDAIAVHPECSDIAYHDPDTQYFEGLDKCKKIVSDSISSAGDSRTDIEIKALAEDLYHDAWEETVSKREHEASERGRLIQERHERMMQGRQEWAALRVRKGS